MLGLTRYFGPMADLRERHASQGDVPVSVERGPKVVLLSPQHRGAFTFRGVRQAFTASGIYLSATRLGLGSELWIPLEAIAGCSRNHWADGRHETSFWVEDAQVLVTFPDTNDRFVGWCRERGIAVVDEATENGWLNRR